ncbi:hypothetical protein DAPPUDRAFT_258589 [Daphnia pulex]|uniref:Uncharacterized protein n=1 Tax=Daphnia pulex TaxID=6669 RepID=E9HFN4_DAPPU|nr:hypothetical protein DAPPUDRAFT_258589 [Daphnia pulex]|eukprot:EFX69471.1 hypothetical protein DAPPUDRAFT_258589 [Daphnia pulex]
MDEVAADQLRTPRTAVEPAFMTDNAATGESTKEDDRTVVPENDAIKESHHERISHIRSGSPSSSAASDF